MTNASTKFEIPWHRAIGYLIAGVFLGFAGAYIAHAPLTMGRIAMLAAFGILFLCKNLLARKRTQ